MRALNAKEVPMHFEEKPLFSVSLDARRGETLDTLLVALAMASYEAASALDDGPASGIRSHAMLNPDEAAGFVRGDELVLCYVKGKFCMTHIRRVHRHYLQANQMDRIELEVVSYDGDAAKLFDRADAIMRWLADDETEEAAALPPKADDAPPSEDIGFAVLVPRGVAVA
jgi:hypothetical protein